MHRTCSELATVALNYSAEVTFYSIAICAKYLRTKYIIFLLSFRYFLNPILLLRTRTVVAVFLWKEKYILHQVTLIKKIMYVLNLESIYILIFFLILSAQHNWMLENMT
jgi:hypothetical protein